MSLSTEEIAVVVHGMLDFLATVLVPQQPHTLGRIGLPISLPLDYTSSHITNSQNYHMFQLPAYPNAHHFTIVVAPTPVPGWVKTSRHNFFLAVCCHKKTSLHPLEFYQMCKYYVNLCIPSLHILELVKAQIQRKWLPQQGALNVFRRMFHSTIEAEDEEVVASHNCLSPEDPLRSVLIPPLQHGAALQLT